MRGKQKASADRRREQTAGVAAEREQQHQQQLRERLAFASAKEADTLAELMQHMGELNDIRPVLADASKLEDELAIEKAAAKNEIAALKALRKAIVADISSGRKGGLLSEKLMGLSQVMADDFGAVRGGETDRMTYHRLRREPRGLE